MSQVFVVAAFAVVLRFGACVPNGKLFVAELLFDLIASNGGTRVENLSVVFAWRWRGGLGALFQSCVAPGVNAAV